MTAADPQRAAAPPLATTAAAPLALSVIVPVYNGAACIGATVRALIAYLDALGQPSELIVVDDGSTDGTLEAVRAAMVPTAVRVRMLRSARNEGKGAAVAHGVRAATGARVVFLDADLAYPPSEIGAICAALDDGAEVAIASRVNPGSRYVVRPQFFRYVYARHVAGRFVNWLVRLVLLPGLTDTQAGLKGFTAAAARQLFAAPLPHRFSFDLGLLFRARQLRLPIREVAVSFRYDSEPSTVRFTRDTLSVLRDLAHLRGRAVGRMPERARRAWLRPLVDAPGAAPVLVGVASFALAALAVARLTNAGGVLASTAWLVSLAAFALLAWRGDRDIRPWRWVRRPREAWLCVAVLVGGAALRLVNLSDWPPMIHIDSAECGLLGLALRRGEVPDPFDFSPWYSTPYLGFVPYALSFGASGGVSIGALRLPSAIIGTLSLVPLYVLARTWFGVRTALLSTALLAVSHAAIHFSRIGLWNIQTLFCTLSAFALLAVALRRNQLLAAYGAGAISGLALYSYTAGRLITIVALAFLALQLLGRRRRRTVRLAAGYVLGIAVAVAPLLLNYVKDPSILATDRTASVWVFAEENRPHVEATIGTTAIAPVLASQVSRSLAGFLNVGDTSSQYGTEQPLLSPWMALLAIAGLVVALRAWRAPRYRFLVLWAGLGMLLGSILVIDPPSYTRLVVLFPVPYLLAAIGLAALLRRAVARWPALVAARATIYILVVAVAATFNLTGYVHFVDYMRRMPREWDVLQVMSRIGGNHDYYLFTGPFLLGDSSLFRLFAADARTVSGFTEEDLPERLSRDSVFIVQGEFPGLGAAISERFPGATREVFEDEGNRQMVVYQCSRDNACRTSFN